MSGAEKITRALRGRWYRKHGLAYCPSHQNERTPALTLADGRGGRLLASCKAGCTFSEVTSALRDLGLTEGSGRRYWPDHGEEARRRAEELAETFKRAVQVRDIWAETQPIAGTVAEAYLRRRAIRAPMPRARARALAVDRPGPSLPEGRQPHRLPARGRRGLGGRAAAHQHLLLAGPGLRLSRPAPR